MLYAFKMYTQPPSAHTSILKRKNVTEKSRLIKKLFRVTHFIKTDENSTNKNFAIMAERNVE